MILGGLGFGFPIFVSVLANSLEISSTQRLCNGDVDQEKCRENTRGVEEKQNIYNVRITLQQAFSK